jgi:hypothetical protein
MMKARLFFLFVLCFFSLAPSTTMAQSASCDFDAIAADIGTYSLFASNDNATQVILIEEQHDLLTGQVESAMMINRMVADCGLEVLGLEGFFAGQTLDPSYAGAMPDDLLFNTSAMLLVEGEISQAEFAALIYPRITPNFSVQGVDDAELYATTVQAQGEYTYGLFLTAITVLALEDDQSQLNEVLDLLDQDAPAGAIQDATYLRHPDARFTEWYEAAIAPDACYPEGSEDFMITEIENTELGISLLREYQDVTEQVFETSLDDAIGEGESLLAFYRAAEDRSSAMVSNIDAIADGQGIIAVVIGAAHTRGMAHSLESMGYGVGVLSPYSLCNPDEALVLDYDAYEQKLEGGSVDAPGGLGNILAGRKPPTSIAQPHIQTKSALYGIQAFVAQALLTNPNATLQEIADSAPSLPGITIDVDSLEQVGDGRYVFRVALDVQDVAADEIYVGVINDAASGGSGMEPPNFGNIDALLGGELDGMYDRAREQRLADAITVNIPEGDNEDIEIRVPEEIDAEGVEINLVDSAGESVVLPDPIESDFGEIIYAIPKEDYEITVTRQDGEQDGVARKIDEEQVGEYRVEELELVDPATVERLRTSPISQAVFGESREVVAANVRG